jgi:BirA family biotin operon repressor/biotin-[acetyl-CoA-carboxylase] ligase
MTNDQLPTTNNNLTADSITAGLQTRMLGRRIIFYDRIGSTNDAARQLADAGEPEGTVVIADEQTAGRGRLGRVWVAPSRSSILMSIILRPMLAPAQASRVTMAVALGACEAIRDATGLDVQIKWPNDLLARGKKLAGILSESGIVGDTLEHVIVGIGVNVNFSFAEKHLVSLRNQVFEELGNATTIADELGKSFSRVQLVQALLVEIEKYYTRIDRDFRAEYCPRCVTLNQLVRSRTPHGFIEGVAEGVNENGALLLRRADGVLMELLAGDVTLSPRS